MVHSYIITGFLGVGKSSMLTNTIKNHFKDKKVALVVNEFGEVGVDQNILKNVHSEVVEISEGCICCQMAQEFASGVLEIINKYSPEIIFVETSGAAEPLPVFISLQNLGIAIDGVICVVDVKNYHSYIDNTTVKHQIGGSNIIVLNKTDLVDEEELSAAKIDIINYKEMHDLKNTLTGVKVFNNYFLHTAQQGVVAQEVFAGTYQIEEIVGLIEEYQSDEHTHDKIDKELAKVSKEITFSELDKLLQSLPKSIYRVKGMVKTVDMATPIIVNYSFGNVTFEELHEYDGESILVFIGENIYDDFLRLCDEFKFLEIKKLQNPNNRLKSNTRNTQNNMHNSFKWTL